LTDAHEAEDDTRLMERTFTPEEANRALAEVRPLVESMVRHRRELAAAQAQRAEALASIAGNGGGMPPSELAELALAVERASSSLAEVVRALDALGVQVKDLDTGLVDFPARRGDEDVLLCWQLGEPEVAWWHGPEDGFAGRRPLPLD
jgi:hypothetical protein